MQHKEKKEKDKKAYFMMLAVFGIVLLTVSLLYYFTKDGNSYEKINDEINTVAVTDLDEVENGIHLRTGLIAGEGMLQVIQNCTNCHSAKLVIQNRLTREQWQATIRWMQETQNLWDLGVNEEIILSYLEVNYPPNKEGRRQNLSHVNWYALEEE